MGRLAIITQTEFTSMGRTNIGDWLHGKMFSIWSSIPMIIDHILVLVNILRGYLCRKFSLFNVSDRSMQNPQLHVCSDSPSFSYFWRLIKIKQYASKFDASLHQHDSTASSLIGTPAFPILCIAWGYKRPLIDYRSYEMVKSWLVE